MATIINGSDNFNTNDVITDSELSIQLGNQNFAGKYMWHGTYNTVAGAWGTAITNRGIGTTGNNIYAPISGVYHLSMEILSAHTSAVADAYARLNGGTIIVHTRGGEGHTGYKSRSLNITVYMNAGDYLDVVNSNPYTNSNDQYWQRASFVFLGE